MRMSVLKIMKSKLRFLNYRKIIAIVLLMNFLIFPMYAEQPMEQQTNLSESETRFYSDLEVDLLIDDLTVIALEAIEQAAGEAARAAFLQSLEREAEAMREAARQQAENLRLRSEAEILRRAGIKNNILIGVLCFIGGLAIGAVGTILIIR